jgi:ABC-type dipeptide/oligopeptide/nickel transport system permease component
MHSIEANPGWSEHPMIVVVLKRISQLLLVVIGMSLLMFIASRMLPGDPVLIAAGGMDATTETVERVRKEYGLDRTLLVQYLFYMKHIAQGDFGRSLVDRQPIADKLKLFYPATIELTVFGILFACLVGIPLGVFSAVRNGGWLDHLCRVSSLFLVSMPIFWLGLIFIYLFYGLFQILPSGGRIFSSFELPPHVTGFLTVDSILAGEFGTLLAVLQHLIMPSIVLGSVSLGIIARMTRACVLEILYENYIITGRAKGLSEKAVVLKYALRNAAIPIVTIIGLQFGVLIGGAVLTETVFSWPGVGRFAIEAVDNKDYPAIMGFAITYSFLYAVINILMDLIYAWLNPKISFQ